MFGILSREMGSFVYLTPGGRVSVWRVSKNFRLYKAGEYFISRFVADQVIVIPKGLQPGS